MQRIHPRECRKSDFLTTAARSSSSVVMLTTLLLCLIQTTLASEFALTAVTSPTILVNAQTTFKVFFPCGHTAQAGTSAVATARIGEGWDGGDLASVSTNCSATLITRTLSNGNLTFTFDASPSSTCPQGFEFQLVMSHNAAVPPRSDIQWSIAMSESGNNLRMCDGNQGTSPAIQPIPLSVNRGVLIPSMRHSKANLTLTVAISNSSVSTYDDVWVDLGSFQHTASTTAAMGLLEGVKMSHPSTGRSSLLRFTTNALSDGPTSGSITISGLYLSTTSMQSYVTVYMTRSLSTGSVTTHEGKVEIILSDYQATTSTITFPDFSNPSSFSMALLLPYIIDADVMIALPSNFMCNTDYSLLPEVVIENLYTDSELNVSPVDSVRALTVTQTVYVPPSRNGAARVPSRVRFHVAPLNADQLGATYSSTHADRPPVYLRVTLKMMRLASLLPAANYTCSVTMSNGPGMGTSYSPFLYNYPGHMDPTLLPPTSLSLTSPYASGPAYARSPQTLTLRVQTGVDLKVGDRVQLYGGGVGQTDFAVVPAYPDQQWELEPVFETVGTEVSVFVRIVKVGTGALPANAPVGVSSLRRLLDMRVTWSTPSVWGTMYALVDDSLNQGMARTAPGTLLSTEFPSILPFNNAVSLFKFTTPHGFYANSNGHNVAHLHFRTSSLRLIPGDRLLFGLLGTRPITLPSAGTPITVTLVGATTGFKIEQCYYAHPEAGFPVYGVECPVDLSSAPLSFVWNPTGIFIFYGLYAPATADSDTSVPTSASLHIYNSANTAAYVVALTNQPAFKTSAILGSFGPEAIPIVYTWDRDTRSRFIVAARKLTYAASTHAGPAADAIYQGCANVRSI